MRIFGMVFGGLLVAAVVGLGIWKFYPGLIMKISSDQLKSDMNSLRTYLNEGATNDACEKNLEENNYYVGYQLRFTGDTEYVIETVCESYGTGKVVKKRNLYGGVKRLYGAGVMLEAYGDKNVNGWVHLAFGDKQTVVGYFDNEVEVKWDMAGLSIGGENPPHANCTDWGFSCCTAGFEKGEGAQVKTPDCINSCRQRCSQLPITLFFNTDPLLDQSSRTVTLFGPKVSVDFGFEIDDMDDQIDQVSLDFGDGSESRDLEKQESLITHVYECGQSRCEFEARLMATDSNGNNLAETPMNKVKVILQP